MKSKSHLSLNKQIARIALPAIVSNITVPLLGLCDTGVTGHLGNARFVAAIAVGTMMLNVLFWSFGFLRMGTTGLTAQAFGAKNERETKVLFTRALLLAFTLGIALIALQSPLRYLLIKIIGSDTNVSQLAEQYFNICVWQSPALLGTMAVSGWFLGMQNSTRPMVIAITTNIINIVGSILLTFTVGMGFPGTATGTLIANWFALVLALVLVWNFCGGSLPFVRLKEAINLQGLGRFFKVNGDIFFRSFFIMAVSLGITSLGARYGELTLAANAVMMQFFFLFSYFMDGLAFAAEALSGKATGARNLHQLGRVVKRLLAWSVGVAAFFTITYTFGYKLFAEWLVPEPSLLSRIEELRIWLWLIPLSSFLAFIFDGFFIGLTATRSMLIVTALASTVFFAVNFLLPQNLLSDGATVIWLSFELYLFIRGATLAATYHREVKNLKAAS